MAPLPLDWMMHADIYILNHIAEHDEIEQGDIILSPQTIGAATGYRRSYVAERARELKKHGLLREPDDDELPTDVSPRGLMAITDLGHRYLSGDLTDEEAERLSSIGQPPNGEE